MIQKILSFLLICSLFFIAKNEVFWSSGIVDSSEKSIIELNSNIQELEKEKVELDGKWDTFQSQYEGITGFIKQDLTPREAFEIEEITYIYNSRKKTFDLQLVEKLKKLEDTTKIKKNSLELKKDFYKDIANYVEPEKLDQFLEYIKWDIEFNEKNREVKQTLYKEKVVLQEKVDDIKTKIEENQKLLDKRIEILIREKLAEKIRLLKENPKYQRLTTEWKIVLFEKALEKTSFKKSELLPIESKTSFINKRIGLYSIVEQELFQEIQSLKNEQQ